MGRPGWYRWMVTVGIFPDTADLKETPCDALRSVKRRKPGDTVFEYNSINTFVVAQIVEALAGKPLKTSAASARYRTPDGSGDFGLKSCSHRRRASASWC